jgi:hypothetical protein
VQSNPNEANTSTKQLAFVDGGYAPTGEVVPSGCLGKETSDVLVGIMLGEKHPQHSKAQSMAALALVATVPPLLAGLTFGVVPYKDPSLGFVGSGFAVGQAIEFSLVGPGFTVFLCVALGVAPDLRKTIAFTLMFALVAGLTLFMLGETWMFPTREFALSCPSFFTRRRLTPTPSLVSPHPATGAIIAPSASLSVACPVLFSMVFGKKIFTDRALIKRLLPLLGVALLPIVFLVVFAFYRAAFIQMGPGQQALFAPVWPILKLGLKKAAAALVDAGGNPDAAPYLVWALDAVSAMAGNFLFISASGISSVFTMISVDVVESACPPRRKRAQNMLAAAPPHNKQILLHSPLPSPHPPPPNPPPTTPI